MPIDLDIPAALIDVLIEATEGHVAERVTGAQAADLVGRLQALGWSLVPTFDLDRMRRTLAETPYAAGVYGAERMDLNEGGGKGHPLATSAQTAEALDALKARLLEAGARAQRQADDLSALRSDLAAVRRVFGITDRLVDAAHLVTTGAAPAEVVDRLAGGYVDTTREWLLDGLRRALDRRPDADGTLNVSVALVTGDEVDRHALVPFVFRPLTEVRDLLEREAARG